jgi:hypothetical protein
MSPEDLLRQLGVAVESGWFFGVKVATNDGALRFDMHDPNGTPLEQDDEADEEGAEDEDGDLIDFFHYGIAMLDGRALLVSSSMGVVRDDFVVADDRERPRRAPGTHRHLRSDLDARRRPRAVARQRARRSRAALAPRRQRTSLKLGPQKPRGRALVPRKLGAQSNIIACCADLDP